MNLLYQADFAAHPSALAAMRRALDGLSAAFDVDELWRSDWVLAVNEACMNVIQHGYAYAPAQQMQLRVFDDAGTIRVQVLDNGKPCCLGMLCPRALDELRPGGLGVHFMREVMDDIVYLTPPAGFKNLLQMSKAMPALKRKEGA